MIRKHFVKPNQPDFLLLLLLLCTNLQDFHLLVYLLLQSNWSYLAY